MDNRIISQLLKQFQKEYDFLYTHDNVAGEDEAIAWFDANVKNPEVTPYISALNKERGDIISSDREAAAFAFACEVLDIPKTHRVEDFEGGQL